MDTETHLSIDFAWLADRLVPFLESKNFLFFARISRDFRRAYAEHHGDTTTSLLAVVEETASFVPSRRLHDVIVCLKSLPRRGGKPSLQSLRQKAKEASVLIPPAALLVLILGKAVKTCNAVSFTKTLAEFLSSPGSVLPPACLFLAHLDGPYNSILEVVEICAQHGMMEEVKQMFTSIGLSLDFLLPPGVPVLLQLCGFVWDGNVDAFHARLKAHIKHLVRGGLTLLHDLVYRRRPLMKKTRGEREVNRALEYALLLACMETDRLIFSSSYQIENEIWSWFVLHWPRAEVAR
uniref:Uncharacterized protein n=1 Tax=Chromera velia CCMP2878 TaxID=1169474 RepID=A0A0G4FGE2_9ALVE|eukprot:Cvel_16868.t1-p1 / transcript=Cvel_16868.t1 / gene=Cvel_16868 / organism=Chromera_velia_CCMP2878 / gene_product=hypothetical protein / transcript_product=hypothetical protein / location=Cvel_scaffold1319:47153-48028(+) / protein_length=292 / sequence_SO=supercontig / SO=protein_coding / is_pseudo=false